MKIVGGYFNPAVSKFSKTRVRHCNCTVSVAFATKSIIPFVTLLLIFVAYNTCSINHAHYFWWPENCILMPNYTLTMRHLKWNFKIQPQICPRWFVLNCTTGNTERWPEIHSITDQMNNYMYDLTELFVRALHLWNVSNVVIYDLDCTVKVFQNCLKASLEMNKSCRKKIKSKSYQFISESPYQ